MSAWPWRERSFRFDYPLTKFPDVLARVVGTPPRLERLLAGVPAGVLMTRPDAGWSIPQSAGHRLDDAPLRERWVAEYLAGANGRSAAGMSNQKTHAARHDVRAAAELLAEFRAARPGAVQRLGSLGANDGGRVAEHPRRRQTLRRVDLLTFVCEHDDDHLARLLELRTRLGAPRGPGG